MPKKRTKAKGGKKDRLAQVSVYDDVNPDLEDEQVLNNEIDQFVNDKNKKSLNRAKKLVSGRKITSGPKEVYALGSDSDEEASDNDLSEDFDSDSEIIDRKKEYLPSADAWGKKRTDFYSTDYVDKDYGGFSDASDEEMAALEEIEANNLQKRIVETTQMQDYQIPQVSAATEIEISTKDKIGEKSVGILESSETSKNELDSDELKELFEDLKSKQFYLDTKIMPLLGLVQDRKLPDLPVFNVIRQQATVYASYCLNVHFYFYLLSPKGGHSLVQANAHPVLDKIIYWRKLMLKIDALAAPIAPNIEVILENVGKFEDDADDVGDDDEYYEEDNVQLEMQAIEPADGKRPIDYTISKNKGLLPKRKKEQRNPRVKHKNKFRKAQIRRKSQIPEIRSQSQKYAGEARGIKAHLVKSVKLS